MADTGWQIPGTIANDSTLGSSSWDNPTNAASSDNSRATGNDSSGTYYLKCTNFGLSIPSGSVVNGIEVRIERRQSGPGGGSCTDNVLKIVKSDGSFGSEDKATSDEWSLSDTYDSYGGSNDLWSESWVPADINDVNFGVGLSAVTSFAIAEVDSVQIKVYYTELISAITGISSIQGINSITF